MVCTIGGSSVLPSVRARVCGVVSEAQIYTQHTQICAACVFVWECVYYTSMSGRVVSSCGVFDVGGGGGGKVRSLDVMRSRLIVCVFCACEQ